MNPETLQTHTPLPIPRIIYMRKPEEKWKLSQLLDGRLEQKKWIRITIRHELATQYRAHKKRLKVLVKAEKKAFKAWAKEQRQT